jgi:predicted amidophosphoribosyltransferase
MGTPWRDDAKLTRLHTSQHTSPPGDRLGRLPHLVCARCHEPMPAGDVAPLCPVCRAPVPYKASCR